MRRKPVPVNETRPAAAGSAVGGPVHLSAHGFEIDLDPAHGARIDRATFGGQPVLHPRTVPGEARMLESGSFPLVPFSNRIRLGQFDFQGRRHELAPNWQGDRHAIHGEGWMRAWDVVRASSSEAVLRFEGAGWWPWRFGCEQRVAIREKQIELSLALTNRDRTPMPAGLGFHPYFPRTSRTTLEFSARRIWTPMNGQPLSPRPLGTEGFEDGRSLSGLDLDHCIDGWTGGARVMQPDLGFAIDIEVPDNPGFAVVYVPEGGDSFCFEPVSHVTGAFELPNRERHGLRILDPGETMRFEMRLNLSEL